MDSNGGPGEDPGGAYHDLFVRNCYSLTFVEVPHKVQMIMASEKLPSLCGMIPTIEIFMTGWEDLSKKQPCLKCFIKPGLKFAVKYYWAIDNTSSYIIAMCKS